MDKYRYIWKHSYGCTFLGYAKYYTPAQKLGLIINWLNLIEIIHIAVFDIFWNNVFIVGFKCRPSPPELTTALARWMEQRRKWLRRRRCCKTWLWTAKSKTNKTARAKTTGQTANKATTAATTTRKMAAARGTMAINTTTTIITNSNSLRNNSADRGNQRRKNFSSRRTRSEPSSEREDRT